MTVRRPGAFGLPLNPDRLRMPERYPFGAEAGGGGRIIALARALASSPVWLPMEEAILVVRPEPPEGIAFLGAFSDEEASFLEWLPGQLEETLPRFHYLSWKDVEESVELLADGLVDRFGRQHVADMDYLGIPRGGLIVLGMLSYALALGSDRITGREGSGRPVIVVDDCALTGVRFGEYLRGQLENRGQVIFAHLYSHPHLRTAILEREPKVMSVVAAGDLFDFAPELRGEDLEGWRERWSSRTGTAAYWVGRPEHLGFPWSEPDITFWNARTEREVAGWRIVPPEACLKARFNSSGGPSRLQVQPASRGSIRPGPQTFHGELKGRVLVANLMTREVIAMGGVAADIWRALVRHGEMDAAVDDLAQEYDVSRRELRDDVRSLVEDLAERGFLLGHG